MSVDVTTIQETYFTCDRDSQVLKGKCYVFSAYGDNCSRESGSSW